MEERLSVRDEIKKTETIGTRPLEGQTRNLQRNTRPTAKGSTVQGINSCIGRGRWIKTPLGRERTGPPTLRGELKRLPCTEHEPRHGPNRFGGTFKRKIGTAKGGGPWGFKKKVNQSAPGPS